MTGAGSLALAVGRGAAPCEAQREKDPKKTPPSRKPFASFTDHIGPGVRRGNRQGGKIIFADSWGDLYYLWTLERVAMIYDLKTIGGKNWYDWASKVIVEAQQDDGSWRDAFPGAADTCFALLVLKRANVVQDLTRDVKKRINLKDIEGGRVET